MTPLTKNKIIYKNFHLELSALHMIVMTLAQSNNFNTK